MNRKRAIVLAAAIATLAWALGAEVLLNLAEDGNAAGWWFVFLTSPIPYVATFAIVYGLAVEDEERHDYGRRAVLDAPSGDSPLERALAARRQRSATPG